MKKRRLTVKKEIEILHDTIDSDAPAKTREAARDRLVEIQGQRKQAGAPDAP